MPTFFCWCEQNGKDIRPLIKNKITEVNFINILPAAFTCADPKSVKKTDNLTVFFMLSGSALAKAARRMLTGVNFTYRKDTDDLTVFCAFGICVPKSCWFNMLVKLTPGGSRYWCGLCPKNTETDTRDHSFDLYLYFFASGKPVVGEFYT